MSLDTIERLALARHGLIVRGGFHPQPEDNVPALPDGAPVATIVMLGNAGAALWAAFTASPEYRERPPHALDAWTRRIVDGVAAEVGASAWYPFGEPPHLPFQRWAMRADTVWPSPVQVLIHPAFGLWHAYRAALAFTARLALPPRAEGARPCDSCVDRPCLARCPVHAFTAAGYAWQVCRDHLRTEAGRPCLETACQARHACPIGRQYRYEPAQAEWHMRGFLG